MHTTAVAASQPRANADIDIAPLLCLISQSLSLSDRAALAVPSRKPTAFVRQSQECDGRRRGRRAAFARARPGGASALLLLSARRSAPLVEPGAILRHLRALRPRCISLARRRLFALLRRAPAQLTAVVQVVPHLEVDRAVD